MNLWAIYDATGVYGSVFHYAFVIAFVGSAFIIFVYLWKNQRLDMDEEPKFQMMQEEKDHHQGNNQHATKQ